jgi:tetratricopeptide (TPR) repeat protein
MGQYEHALAEYQKALEIDPKASVVHRSLGYFFLHRPYRVESRNEKQLEAAITEFKKAIELDPNDSDTHCYLGDALRSKNQIDDAISELEKAIGLDPKSSEPHWILGQIYEGKHQLDRSIAEYREGIRLDPKADHLHLWLAMVLRQMGNLQESLEEYRTAERLASKRPWRAFPLSSYAADVRVAEQVVELESKLPAILEGKEKPASDAERLELASFCRLEFKQLYAASFRFYAEAFANDPKLAADVNSTNRQEAAWSAVLAGCGKGRDADKLTDKERARMRKQALEWLRADLTHWTQRATSDRASDLLQSLESVLKYWQQTADLACVRDKDSLEKLPAEERDAWEKLWDDVEQLRKAEADRWVRLEAKLPDVLAGTATPADNKERLGLAELCRWQSRFAAATRLYGAVFDADAQFADDVEHSYRYNAACVAALGAAGKGKDADKLDDQARGRLRKQALEWVRADLALWTKQADSDKPDTRVVVQGKMQHWQRDTDLASVRDKDALEKLPAEERDAWRKLWDDVAALIARTQEKK